MLGEALRWRPEGGACADEGAEGAEGAAEAALQRTTHAVKEACAHFFASVLRNYTLDLYWPKHGANSGEAWASNVVLFTLLV